MSCKVVDGVEFGGWRSIGREPGPDSMGSPVWGVGGSGLRGGSGGIEVGSSSLGGKAGGGMVDFWEEGGMEAREGLLK
jgi:hypothetical protein